MYFIGKQNSWSLIFIFILFLFVFPKNSLPQDNAPEQTWKMEIWEGAFPDDFKTSAIKLGETRVSYDKGFVSTRFPFGETLSANVKAVIYEETAHAVIKYLKNLSAFSVPNGKNIKFGVDSLFYEIEGLYANKYCYSPYVSPPPIQLAVGIHCLGFNPETNNIEAYYWYSISPFGKADIEVSLSEIKGAIVYEPLNLTMGSAGKAGPFLPKKSIQLRKVKKKKIEIGIADEMNFTSWFMGSKMKPRIVKKTVVEISTSEFPTTITLGGAEILLVSVEGKTLVYKINNGFNPWAFLDRKKELLIRPETGKEN